MALAPLGNNVVLKEKRHEETSVSGIVLTGDHNRGSSRGIVIATGPDATLVTVGDVVVVDWKNGKIAKTDTGDFVVVSQNDILAVVEE